jgi:hypothetical protein
MEIDYWIIGLGVFILLCFIAVDRYNYKRTMVMARGFEMLGEQLEAINNRLDSIELELSMKD